MNQYDTTNPLHESHDQRNEIRVESIKSSLQWYLVFPMIYLIIHLMIYEYFINGRVVFNGYIMVRILKFTVDITNNNIMNTFNCSVEEAESNDESDIKCVGDVWYTSLTEDKASSTTPKHDPIWLTWDGSVSSYIIDLDYITNLYFVLPDVVTLSGSLSKSADLMGSVSSLKPSNVKRSIDSIIELI
eukprot:787004_1